MFIKVFVTNYNYLLIYIMASSWIFQYDNDPKHMAKITQQWLTINKIDIMQWPPQSPYLNPIENSWKDLKKTIFEFKPQNSKQLWEITRNAWVSILVERYQQLIDSMPHRVRSVLTNKGEMTKYWFICKFISSINIVLLIYCFKLVITTIILHTDKWSFFVNT